MHESLLGTIPILQIAHAPGAGGGTVANVQTPLEFLVFPAWGPLPLAHGFPDGLTVIGKVCKTLIKQSKTSSSVLAHSYGSLAVRWGRTREGCESQRATLENHCKTKGSAFALAPFLHNRVAPANGFPDPLTVIGNTSKHC